MGLAGDDQRTNYELRDRVRERIEEASRHAAREAARKTAMRAASGYFALLLILLVGAYFDQKGDARDLRTAVRGSCQRVNTLRVEETNRGQQVLWKAMYLARQRSEMLARATTGEQRRTHRLAIRQLSEFVDVIRWTPETDCAAVSRDPGRYVPPAPRRFDPKKHLDLKVVPR